MTCLLAKFVQERKQLNLTLTQHGQQSKQMDHLTVCLIVVAVCFLLLVFPYAVVSIICYSKPTSCSFFRTLYSTIPMSLMNFCVNFGIYFWKLVSFRQAVKTLFHCFIVSQTG